MPLQSPLPQVYQSGSAIISTDSHEKDDSPDSQKTVTPRSRSWDANTGTAAQPNMPTIAESGTNSPIEPPRSVPLTGSYFAAKADEGVRYLALKHEKLKAAQTEELRAEIRGQRVWRLGGMGMWAYSESTLQEIEKEELWRTEGQECGREGWLESARKRTEYYSSMLTACWDFSANRKAPWVYGPSSSGDCTRLNLARCPPPRCRLDTKVTVPRSLPLERGMKEVCIWAKPARICSAAQQSAMQVPRSRWTRTRCSVVHRERMAEEGRY